MNFEFHVPGYVNAVIFYAVQLLRRRLSLFNISQYRKNLLTHTTRSADAHTQNSLKKRCNQMIEYNFGYFVVSDLIMPDSAFYICRLQRPSKYKQLFLLFQFIRSVFIKKSNYNPDFVDSFYFLYIIKYYTTIEVRIF